MESSSRLLAAIRDAVANGSRLSVSGSGSKRHLLPATSADMLTTAEHRGVVAYDPSELVVTARAGTPLKELQAELAQHNQRLAADPPMFLGQGTVGGMVAAGLSGPGRPWSGAVRDAVLGIVLVNGLGQALTFGGQVMKNVAGYDVSRLVCGAYGALGVVLEVSLRVAPAFEAEDTLLFECDAAEAIRRCAEWRQQFLPLQGTWWQDDRLHVRLGGSAAAVADGVSRLGGARSNLQWDEVRDHSLEFFKALSANTTHGALKLFRLAMPPAAPPPDDTAAMALAWGGGLRWWWCADAENATAYAGAHGGWAWELGAAPPIPAPQKLLMRRIKQAFDPHDLFATPVDLGT